MARKKKEEVAIEEKNVSKTSSILDKIRAEVNKDCGEEVITVGVSNYSYQRIPFTSPRMNFCTFGGIPVGKITEFYGEENSGKTTTALDIIANYQNMPEARKVLYVDVENTLDIEWARQLGVITDDLEIYQPKGEKAYAEYVFQVMCRYLESGEIGLWVLDSIGALMSKQEIDKDIEDKTYAGISQALTRFSKKAELLCAQHNCTGIGINQERANLNSPYGGTVTPGGKAWRYHCSMRLRFSKGKYLNDKREEISKSSAETPAGNIVHMAIEKTKVCSPKRRIGFYTLLYDSGIDYVKDLMDMAIYYGIIDKHGGWFTIVDTETGDVIQEKIQGQANVCELLEQDDDIFKRVEELVNKQIC